MNMDGAHDPVEHAHLLHQVFDSVLGGDAGPAAPRSLVSESWQRSLAAHVDPDRHTPPEVVHDAELPDLRSAHPLNEVMPLLRSTLVSIADEAMHVMLVTDADGTILWREGAAKLLHVADSSGLSPGFRVSEDAIGTNAMGTTLAVDAPVQIHSAEHLVRAFHAWTCAAAPVHDPDTGAILGAIAGAHYGVDAIPSRWLEGLQNREGIEARASALAKGSAEGLSIPDLIATEIDLNVREGSLLSRHAELARQGGDRGANQVI